MEKNPTYIFVVAAALMDENQNILVQKRPEGKVMSGLWEFPGGKVEAGETPEEALVRELKEELDILVDIEMMHPLAFASEPLDGRHLLLLLYICQNWSGTVKSLEETALIWSPVTELKALDMPPADGPLVDQLIKHLRK